jgi:hypothetical protein
MVDWLVADLCRRAVAGTTRYLAIHAAVASRDDRAIILPAAPDGGKSTLVAGMVRAGSSFLSDEVALIDPQTGWVHPFPRPLLLDPSSVAALNGLEDELPPDYELFRLDKYHVAPDDLRAGALGIERPVSLIVQPRYEAGAVSRLEAMSRADALRLLVEQSFNLDRSGGEGVLALAEVVRGATCYRLTFGDLAWAVRIVHGLFGLRADESPGDVLMDQANGSIGVVVPSGLTR